MSPLCWLSLLLVAVLIESCHSYELRSLQSSTNWSGFNALVSSAVIRFPDSELESGGLTLKVSDLQCSNVRVQDIQLTSDAASTTSQQLPLDFLVSGLDMTCTARYEFYGLLIVNGSGDLYVESYGNAALLRTVLESLDYSRYPPHDSYIASCQPTIQIQTLDFSNGGFWGWTLDTLQGMFRGRFEDLAETRLCQELEDMANQDLDQILNDVQNYLVQYNPDSANAQQLNDPLHAETLMMAFYPQLINTQQSNQQLINWQQPDSYPFGFWMDTAWQDTVQHLNTYDTTQNTINANLLLRQHILNPQGVLVVNADGTDDTTGITESTRILYEGQDKWMKTQILLNQVRIKGLDTLTALDPLVTIGKYTLQSKLSWQSLALEMDLELYIQPSTLPDSYITQGATQNNGGIREQITVQLALSQVDAGIGILLALDQNTLEELQLGHFLQKDNILPCFLTSIFQVQVSTLSVQAMDLEPPVITATSSSLSPGLYQVLSNAMNAAFYMYESSLLRSSQAFFQTVIRDVVNQQLEAQKESLSQGEKCTLWELTPPLGNINVRQLLLGPPTVDLVPTSSGGTVGRYGNLFHEFVVPTLQNEVLTDDKLNQRFVRPYTLDQSGREGILMSSTDAPLLDFVQEGTGNPYQLQQEDYYNNINNNETTTATTTNWVTLLGWEQFQFQAKDAILYNIDTITSPVELFVPLDTQLLGNTIRTGDATPDRPLQFTMQLVAQALPFGHSSLEQQQPEEIHNHVELSITIPSSVFIFELFVAMNETALLHFPLENLENEYCWLAAMSSSSTETSPLNLERVVTGLASSFTLDAACVSCSSPGATALPQVLQVLQNAGLTTRFQPYLEDLLANVVQGAFTNMNFDAWIADAHRLCPHDDQYDPLAVPQENLYGLAKAFATPPRWSRQSVETMSTFGFLSLYASLFLLAKNYILQPPPPLVLEEELPVVLNAATNQSSTTTSSTTTTRLLDWTNLSATLGPWADSVLEEARVALQASVMTDLSTYNATRRLEGNETKEETPQVLQADSFIRDHLLDEQGQLIVAFDDMQFDLAGVVFSVWQTRVLGIDSITHLDPFVVVGPQTLQNSLELQQLNVTLDLLVDLGSGETHNMTVSIDFQNIVVEFPLLLAMDVDKLGQIELGSLLKINQVLPCLLEGAHEVFIPRLNVSIGNMGKPSIEGFLSPDLHGVLALMNQVLYDSFGEELAFALPGIFDSSIRHSFNVWLQQYVSQVDPTLCSVEAGGDILDFRDLFLPPTESKSLGGTGREQYGDIFQLLHGVMKQELETKDGEPPSINDHLSSWTADHFNMSGAVNIPGNLLDTTASVKLAGLDAVLAFQLGDIALENIDTLGAPLSLLDPVNAHTLNNTISLGVGTEPLKVKARLMLAISDNEEMQVRNVVDVSVDVYDANALATILLRIREDSFLKFPLKDVPNVFCWLSTILAADGDIHGISLLDESLSLGDMDLNVSCVSCTSPQFGDLVADLYTPASADEATETVYQTLSQILDGEAIQDFLDQVVAESSRKCPHAGDYDPDALITASEYLQNQAEPFGFTDFTERDDTSSYFNIASGIFAAFLLLAFILGKLLIRRSNKKWKESLSSEGMFLLRRQKAREQEQEKIINMYSQSLLHSAVLDAKVRWAVPVMILLNIGLYMGGHLGILSTVDLDVHLAGEEFTIHNFLEFSFIDSTANTYRNGGMEMSIMLWIFTGIWPYVKLLASLFLWLVPPRMLSVSYRGKMLLWIDALTKLSIVDIFTMILALAVLLVYIGGPDEALDAEGALYSMKVIVIPGASCYCIVMAQRMSRVSSRFFLDCHDKVVLAAREGCAKGEVASFYQKEPKSCNEALAEQMDCSDNGWLEDESNQEEESSLNLSPDPKRDLNTGLASADDSPELPRRTFDNTSLPTHLGSAGGSTMSPVDQEMSSVLEKRLSPAPEHVGDKDKECSSIGDQSSATAERGDSRCSTLLKRLKNVLVNRHFGVAFGVLAVLVLLVIGCIYAPSVSVNISDLWGLALESGTTFEEAVTKYGVFSVVSAVLLQSRFVLDTTWDYVALGFLLVVAFVSMGMVFFIGCYQFVRRLMRGGWSAVRPIQKSPAYELPSYLRLHAYKHFEIYVVAVVVGCWQLGSVSIYAIHLYCSILDSVYKVLTYIGLVQPTNAQCFEAQMTLLDNLLIFFGALLILLAKFFIQCSSQYRKNVTEATELLRHEDHDIDKLSSLWNTPSSPKPSFWSSSSRNILNQTASFSDMNSAVDESPGSYDTTRSFATARSSAPLVYSPAQQDSVSLSSVSPGGQDRDAMSISNLPSQ
ncbi:Paraquat-inducible protein A [Seminavis robusta]|uniref:Paraquat-inducible protein A n=1 Tax=Seminavis robusta TaxID=568900 RepID=A0A9N8DBJ3_9STRA|nr:Paraquat-inducible protein A [Seminavis robusta]|eukprot:Sro8_g006800.1 Paraquat-inducible protein A (2302) ;mRNA; r:177750-184895